MILYKQLRKTFSYNNYFFIIIAPQAERLTGHSSFYGLFFDTFAGRKTLIKGMFDLADLRYFHYFFSLITIFIN